MKLLTFLSIASIVIAGGTLELTGVSVNDEIQFNFTVGSSNEEIMLTGVSEQNAVFINRNDDGSCHHELASVLCGYSLTGDLKTLKQSDSRFSNNWYTGNWATDDFTIGTKTLKQMPFGLSKPEVVNITTNSGKVVLTGLKSSFGYGLSTNSLDISDHSFIKHLVDTDTIDRSLFSVHPLKKLLLASRSGDFFMEALIKQNMAVCLHYCSPLLEEHLRLSDRSHSETCTSKLVIRLSG